MINLDLSQPNPIILLRCTLCYSQKQLAEAIGVNQTTIARAENGQTELSKINQLALKGLFLLEAEKYPGLLKTLELNEADKFVQFLMDYSGNTTQMVYFKRPKCSKCHSTNIEPFLARSKSSGKYGFTCLDCEEDHFNKTDINIKRLLYVRNSKGALLTNEGLHPSRQYYPD